MKKAYHGNHPNVYRNWYIRTGSPGGRARARTPSARPCRGGAECPADEIRCFTRQREGFTYEQVDFQATSIRELALSVL
jgi:hypothetical protein